MPWVAAALRNSQSLIQSKFPFILRQLGKAEDKVDADVFHTGVFQNMIGLNRSCSRMATIHKLQNIIIEGLAYGDLEVPEIPQEDLDKVGDGQEPDGETSEL